MNWYHPLGRRWNWLEDGLLPLLLVLLRFCWLWPWLDLIRYIFTPSYQGALLSPGLLVGVPMVSLFLARTVASQETPTDASKGAPRTTISTLARLAVALIGLAVILGALWWQLYQSDYALWQLGWVKSLGLALIHGPNNELSPPVPMLLILVYLWLRGMLDAVKVLGHDDIWGAFVVGVALLVLYLVLMAINHLPIPAVAINLIVLFFAAGMAALAFSSLKITVGLDRALGLGQRRASKTPSLSRYWLASVTTTIVVLLGLGLLLGFVIAPAQIASLLALVRAAFNALWQLISFVLVAVGYLLFVVAYFIGLLLQPLIQWLVSLFGTVQERQPMQPVSPPPMLPSIETTTASVPDVYRWIALGIFTLIVIVIFALVLRRLRAPKTEDFDEERESILSMDLLQDQLAKLLQRLFGNLRTGAAQPPFLSLTDESDTRRTIRSTYQNLLAAATEMGQARPRGQTPREYQQQLAAQLPAATGVLATLTEHYDHARYAAESPDPTDAAAAQQAWAQVQTIIASQSQPPEA